MERTGFIRQIGDNYQVGASDVKRSYEGPIADIKADKTWLYITTCPYDGAVMLNIETLPFLIEALQDIQSEHTLPDNIEGDNSVD